MKVSRTITLWFDHEDETKQIATFKIDENTHVGFVYDYIGEWFKKNVDLSAKYTTFSVTMRHE